MTPRLRKVALTAHITSSVGWLGAVAAFLALAIAGLTSRDAQTVRAVYIATELTTWVAIVPLAFASLLTGLIVSLGTAWGLFRHYWVLMKLLITLLATLLLLVHTQPIGVLAGIARETTLSGADLGRLQIQLVGDAGAALLALLVNVTLSVFKPQGMTPFGRRKQHEERVVSRSIPSTPPDGTKHAAADTRADLPSDAKTNRDTGRTPRWVKVFGISIVVLIVLFKIYKLSVGGAGSHGH